MPRGGKRPHAGRRSAFDSPTEAFSIELTETSWGRLARHQRETGLSLTQLITAVIDQHLDTTPLDAHHRHKRQKAFRIKLPPDIATRFQAQRVTWGRSWADMVETLIQSRLGATVFPALPPLRREQPTEPQAHPALPADAPHGANTAVPEAPSEGRES